MLHLLIDTSVLRRDPQRKSAAFQALARIGNAGGVTTYIPEVVRREFLGYREDEYLSPVESIKKHLEKLRRKPGPEAVIKVLESHLAGADMMHDALRGWVVTEFDLWCGRIGVEIAPVKGHHGQAVLDSYFGGTPPFKEKKNRDDFPDAFILESIRDVAAAVDELHVVIDDHALRKAAVAIDAVVAYESLDRFILSDKCQSIQKDAAAAENFEAIVEELKTQEEEIGHAASTKLFDELVGYTFTDPSIPDDNHEASIEMLDVPVDIGLDWEEAEYYGDGIISVPFDFNTWVLAGYYIFKGDYYSIDEDRMEHIGISEYGNRHYYEAQEEFQLNVIGKLALSLDLAALEHDNFFIQNLDDVLEKISVEASEIEEVTVVEDSDTNSDDS